MIGHLTDSNVPCINPINLPKIIGSGDFIAANILSRLLIGFKPLIAVKESMSVLINQASICSMKNPFLLSINKI